MDAIIYDYWPVFLAALVVGLITAWWIWGRSGQNVSLRSHDDAPITRALAPGRNAPTPPPDSSSQPPPEPLLRIKGVGPRMASLFATSGITTLEQVAALTPNDIDRIEERAGPFKGRIARDRMVDQARLLTGGDMQAYESEFGKIEERSV